MILKSLKYNLLAWVIILFISYPAAATVKIKNVEDLYWVEMQGGITSSIEQYKPLLELLKTADKSKTIILNITTLGGYVSTGDVIVNAIVNSKAYTIAHVSKYANSMGALIGCNTDRLTVAPGAFMIFHYGSAVFPRLPITDIKYYIDGLVEGMTARLNVCLNKNIITQKEIDKMYKGKDVRVLAKDINDRLKLNIKIKALK